MTGYFACLPDAWEIAAASIPRPWDASCAISDLRWWEDEHRMRNGRIPGVRELAARWGWPWRKVDKLMEPDACASWADEKHLETTRAMLLEARARGKRNAPGTLPERSRNAPGTPGQEETPVLEGKRNAPGTLPERSRNADGIARDLLTPLSTDPQNTRGASAPAADAAPPAAGAAASEVTDVVDSPASVLPLPTGTEGQVRGSPEEGGHGAAADRPAGSQGVSGSRRTGADTRKREVSRIPMDSVLRCYASWRAHHPTADATPTDGRVQRIRKAIDEAGEEGVILVFEYVHRPGSWWTSNGKAGIEVLLTWDPKRRATFTTLHDEARAWKGDGKTDKVNGVDALKAWGIVCEMISRFPIPPRATWHPNEEIRRAMDAGLEAVGGSNAVKLREKRAEEWMRARFAQAYEGVHRA